MNILEAMKRQKQACEEQQAAQTDDQQAAAQAAAAEGGQGAAGMGFAGSHQPLQPFYNPSLGVPPHDWDHDGIPDNMDYHWGDGQF